MHLKIDSGFMNHQIYKSLHYQMSFLWGGREGLSPFMFNLLWCLPIRNVPRWPV